VTSLDIGLHHKVCNQHRPKADITQAKSVIKVPLVTVSLISEVPIV